MIVVPPWNPSGAVREMLVGAEPSQPPSDTPAGSVLVICAALIP